MAYTRTHWINRIKDGETVIQEGTPVNQTNMNKIEAGIEDAHEALPAKADKVPAGSFTEGNIATVNDSGGIQDGGLAFSIDENGILNITY